MTDKAVVFKRIGYRLCWYAGAEWVTERPKAKVFPLEEAVRKAIEEEAQWQLIGTCG